MNEVVGAGLVGGGAGHAGHFIGSAGQVRPMDGGAGHAEHFTNGAGPAFHLHAGLPNAGHLGVNMGSAGLSTRGNHGQQNLANQLESIRETIQVKNFAPIIILPFCTLLILRKLPTGEE